MNIRNNLDVFDKYEPVKRETLYLSEFQPVTLAEVRKVLANMIDKSCELDAVGKKFLKARLDYILEEIADLINFSLQFRQFPRNWKNFNSMAADKEDKFTQFGTHISKF